MVVIQMVNDELRLEPSMIIRLVAGENGDVLLPLPEAVLDELDWNNGDEIEMDISMTNPDQLILWKRKEVIQ